MIDSCVDDCNERLDHSGCGLLQTWDVGTLLKCLKNQYCVSTSVAPSGGV